jgi:hypothetical protein
MSHQKTEIEKMKASGLENRHGLSRSRRLKPHSKTDDLTVRIGLRNLHGV